MKFPVPLRRLLGVAVLAGAVVAVPTTSSSPAAAPGCSYCAGGEFHAVPPTRIFDTRSVNGGPINDVAPLGAKPATTADPKFDIDLLGLADPGSYQNAWLPEGVQAADVLGVVVSVTVVSPTVGGWLGAYPTGSPSVNSIVNFTAGQTVANLAIVRPGTNGKLTVYVHGASSGSVNVLVDVSGWYSTSGYLGADGVESTDERGGRLIAVTPGRILDTRGGAKVPAGGVREVQIRGTAVPGSVTIPNTAAVKSVLVNLTSVKPSANTYLSVVPEAPASAPATSNLNLNAGQVRAVAVLTPIGADGKIRIYNGAGNTDVLVDVLGYVEDRLDDTRAGRVIPLTAPFRVFDTRQPEFQNVALGPGQAEDWSFSAFAASVNIGGIAVGNQSALLGNLTNAKLTRQYAGVSVDPSYLTVYPTPASPGNPPTVSNLNSYEAGPVANMSLVTYGSNYQVRVYNAKGYAHYLLDVSAVVLAD